MEAFDGYYRPVNVKQLVMIAVPEAATRVAMAETIEVLQRTWHVEGASVRPDHRMVAHTGFLTHARLLAA